MSVSIGQLKAAFLYRYHRFPGYLQAKRERLAARTKAARWQLEDAWQRTLHPFEPLTGKTREQIKQILFRNPAEPAEVSHHQVSSVVEQYNGFNIFSLEGRYFGLNADRGDLNIESLRANEYVPCFVGHTVPDIKQDIDKFIARDDGAQISRKERALFITNVRPENADVFLNRLGQYDLTILETAGRAGSWGNNPKIDYFNAAGAPAEFINLYDTSEELLEDLKKQDFDLVITPYEDKKYWASINLEVFVSAFAKRLMVMFRNGTPKFYAGEDINRIRYNKFFLNDIFRFLPPLKGKRILEVGCSDGLACDLLLSEDPDAAVGVDCMDAVGCNYPDPRIAYFKMDASDLQFKDGSFDVCYSMATLEHVKDPFAVMQEMKRVTRKGGYCIAQAGPLFHAPFGHHMFGYFDDYPWIHLRLSKDQILEYAIANKIADQIKDQRGMDARDYVYGMLTPEHVNGLRLEEYRLEEFMALPDVKVLNFELSYEGEDLLTENLLLELSPIGKETLTTSGFELIFRIR
jgi:ubiquinone/menaquinone biosynthesis C-methylase UbiE